MIYWGSEEPISANEGDIWIAIDPWWPIRFDVEFEVVQADGLWLLTGRCRGREEVFEIGPEEWCSMELEWQVDAVEHLAAILYSRLVGLEPDWLGYDKGAKL